MKGGVVLLSLFFHLSLMSQVRDAEGKPALSKTAEFFMPRCCHCNPWKIVFIDSVSKKPVSDVEVNFGNQKFVSDAVGVMTVPHKLYVDGRKALFQTVKSKNGNSRFIDSVPDNDTLLLSGFSGVASASLQLPDAKDTIDLPGACQVKVSSPANKRSVDFRDLMYMETIPVLIPLVPVVSQISFRFTGCRGSCTACYSSVIVERQNIDLKDGEQVRILLGGIPGTYGDLPHFIKP